MGKQDLSTQEILDLGIVMQALDHVP